MRFPTFTRLVLAISLFAISSLKFCCSEKFVYKSYQNSAQCSTSTPMQFPNNIEELQKIILDAIKFGKKVKVLGSLHSVTDMICTQDIPISAKKINYMFINPENETVTVGAGAEVLDVLEFLQSKGRTLIHILSFSGVTIGGSIGTGAHGSKLLHPTSISDLVVGVTVIDGLGNIHKIEDPTELQAFRVHLGLLGAIVDVTLRTVPLFKMKVHNYLATESVLFDGTALDMARNRDWFQLWWFPFSEQVVISEGNHTLPETEGTAETNFIPDLTPLEILIAHHAFEAMQATKNLPAQQAFEEFTKLSLYQHVIVGKPPIFYETDQFGIKKFVNPAVGWAYRLQSNRCSNKCAWQNGDNGSIFLADNMVEVEMNQLPNLIRKFKEILREVPAAFVLVGIMIRFAKKSDALLAMSSEWDAVAIEWPTPLRVDPYETARSGLGAFQAISETLFSDFNGRAHWGKNGLEFSKIQKIEKISVEKLQAFHDTMKKYDPNE